MTGAGEFTESERAALTPYFTNIDGQVFALINLPETVKGALFARYSRSAKSLRRLFLDEFDHLDGVLFLDRMKTLESLSYLEEYDRYWVRHEDDEDEDAG